MKDIVIDVNSGAVIHLEISGIEQEKREADAVKAREEANKPIPPSPEQTQINQIEERTVGMQAIDDFTLQSQFTIDERTQGMQEIDDFTLLQVVDLQQQVDQLKADVAALKGGV